MKDEGSGAYLFTRSQTRPRQKRSARRAAGMLIAMLMVLSAGVILLVVFLPPRSSSTSQAVSAFAGKTYYFMYTSESTDKAQAALSAADTSSRGGAGYVFNDGTYKIVAAVYARESDVKTIVSVNPESAYFSVTLNAAKDSAALDYLCGEWFDTVYLASAELDRGNITEAAAEHAVSVACDKLVSLAESSDPKIKRALLNVRYDFPSTVSVLSRIRYIVADVLASVSRALP